MSKRSDQRGGGGLGGCCVKSTILDINIVILILLLHLSLRLSVYN